MMEEFRRQIELDDMAWYVRRSVLAIVLIVLGMTVLAYAGTPKEDRAARLMLLEGQLGAAKAAQVKASRAHDAWLNQRHVAMLPKEMKASTLRTGREDWFGSLKALSDVSEKLYGVPVDFKRDPDHPERGDTFLRIGFLIQRIEAEIQTINDDIMKDP